MEATMNDCIGATPGSPGPSPYFGDGVDGAIHVTAANTPYVLSDTMYASTVLVDLNTTIETQGYAIFASVSFTNNGKVQSNGSAAVGAAEGLAIEADIFDASVGGAGSTTMGLPGGGNGWLVIMGSGPGGAGGAGTPGNAGGNAGT